MRSRIEEYPDNSYGIAIYVDMHLHTQAIVEFVI